MDAVNNNDRFDTTEDDYGVRWGRLKYVKAERFKYYGSFHLDGVEFFVKDTVYLQASDGPPYIAQIGKLRENVRSGKKAMLVYWFFRPCELPEGLPSVDFSENSKEIFMAVGSAHTQMFENPACTVKKCRVVCIADETWNRMPSAKQVAAADHVFDRAFNPAKLRLEKLDLVKKNCGEYIRLRLSGRKSSCSEQAVGNGVLRRDIVTVSRNKMVIMGKPPNHHGADHTGRPKPPQKSPSATPSSKVKAPQGLESEMRPRVDIPEEQIRKRTTTVELKTEKERSLKFSGKHDHLQKRRKIEDPVSGKGEAKNKEAQLLTTRGEVDKGKLGSPPGNVCAVHSDRLPKAPRLDGKNTLERKPEGWLPFTSMKSSGKQIDRRRDGEAGGVSLLGKRLREDSLPSATVMKKLAHHSRPDKRVGEGHLESGHLRPYVSSSQKAGSLSLEHKRSKATVRQSLKEDRNEADLNKVTSLKALREVKLGTKECKDARKQHNRQHLSSTSVTTKNQQALNSDGKIDKTLRESRPLLNAAKIRVAAGEEDGRKLISMSRTQHPPEMREQVSGREVKGSHFHRIADGVGSATDRGTALSSEGHYKPYMPNKKIFNFPWDEKKSVEEAITSGRALLLKSLDPCLNSIAVEAILENVLDTTCDARILPPKTITCYKSAEAVVIFKKAEIAEDVLRTLTQNLLVTSGDERPVLASLLTKSKQSINNFHGFFNLEKFGWKMNDSVDQKCAVATSHCAQSNTVEYDMGLHWRVLQERDTLEWQMLEEDHQKGLQEMRAKYKKS